MKLRLEIKSYHRLSMTQEPRKLLEGGALAIGRDPGSGWVLDDPACAVSGRHCVVEQAGGRWYLTDTSRNGTFVNDAIEPVGPDRRVEINDGDRFRAGDFLIEARLVEGDAPARADLSVAPAGRQDNLVQVLTAIGGARGGSGLVPPGAPEEPVMRAEPPRAKPEEHALPDAEEVLRQIERRLGRRVEPPAEQGAMPPREPPGPVDAGLDRALTLLLAGAGCPELRLDNVPAEEALQRAGALLHAAVAGLLETLATRALVRSELRVRRTLAGSADNNPLKFSTDPEDALAKLLHGRRRGQAEPVAAMREAFADLRGHELAVMGALQATLRALLDRLDPEDIAREAEGALAPLRGGRCWAEYQRRHADLLRELQDDFHRGLGRDFARAYEAHTNRAAGQGRGVP